MTEREIDISPEIRTINKLRYKKISVGRIPDI